MGFKNFLFFFLSLFSGTVVSNAETVKTIFNPFTGKQDYITVLSSNTLTSGSSNYIQNSSTLQSGATAYPDFVYVGTSQTVYGPLIIGPSLTFGSNSSPGHNIYQNLFNDVGTISAEYGWDNSSNLGYYWDAGLGSSSQLMTLPTVGTKTGDLNVTYGITMGSATASSSTTLPGASFGKDSLILFLHGDGQYAPYSDARDRITTGGPAFIIFGSTITTAFTGNPLINFGVDTAVNLTSDPGSKAINNIHSVIVTSGTTSSSNVTLRGLNFIVQHNGTGTMGTQIGMVGNAINNNTGTVNIGDGARAGVSNNGGGTINIGHCFTANTLNNNGTIGQQYAFLANNQTVGNLLSPSYAFYNAGTADLNYFAGNTGFGNTAPTAAQVDIVGTTGVSGQQYSLRVTTSTSVSTFFHVAVSTSGHIITQGPAPTISVCGVAPAGSVVGDDNEGIITIGGGVVTACTLTFSNTWGTTPVCTITDNSTAITGDISTLNLTTMTTSFSASLGGGLVYYRCGCSGTSCR